MSSPLFSLLQFGTLATLLIGCAGTRSSNSDIETPEYLQAYGFVESEDQRATVEEAVRHANNILLGAGRDTRIQCSWLPPERGAVPVHVIKRHERGSFGPCFVLPKVDAVLVDAQELLTFDDRFGYEDGDIDPVPMLAVLLLHEAGHLEGGHNHEAAFAVPLLEAAPNLDESEAKVLELEADAFAASSLRSAFQPGNPGFDSALPCQMQISMVSFYLTGKRVVEDFGASPARVFWDRSYTHPNLELRFLHINHELTRLPESQSLLEEFLAMRKGSGSFLDGAGAADELEETVDVSCLDGCGYLGLALSEEGLQFLLSAHAQAHPDHRYSTGE